MRGFRLLFSCLITLVIGFLAGVYVDHANAHNHIRFQVNSASTKVALTPEVGDILEWYAPDGTTPVTAQFLDPGFSPCAEGSNPQKCHVVLPSYAGAIFNYTCTVPNEFNCFDPAVGPVSRTGTGGGTGAFWHTLQVDLFGEGKPAPPAPFEPVHGGGVPVSSDFSVVTPSVSCTATTNAVGVVAPNGVLNDPTHASPKDRIAWAPQVDFSVTNPTLDGVGTPLCTNGSSFGPTTGCQVAADAKAGSYSYTVTAAACTGGTTAPEKIILP